MANITYTVNENSPENISGVEQYLSQDTDLIASFQVNSTFIPTKHLSELHILTLSDDLVESDYNYNNYKFLQNAQSTENGGASVLTIDPVQDVKLYGYDIGGIKLLYHFLNNLYAESTQPVEFYIDSISPDRTEVRLSTLNLTSEAVLATTSNIVRTSQNRSYQDEFRLNFKNNDLLIVVNIDSVQVGQDTMVAIKLYESLPVQYGLKSILSIVEIVSDSIAYQVSTKISQTVSTAPYLRAANFDVEVEEESVIPTGYFSYDELFSYPINSSNSQIFSTVNEKGIDISIDYSDFNNFIQFSSAQERLLNFKYKADLVNSYTVSRDALAGTVRGASGVLGSKTYYEGLIEGIVSNFDHYERHLYYESGSTSWPKSNKTRPYTIDINSTDWYQAKLEEAAAFDETSNTSLVSTVPAYLRDDINNQNYLTFIYMIGQHFDNLWIYTQAVTDKYDADNRLYSGISKDLVAEALRNFGVKLYTSNKSVEDLFATFIGQEYQPGNEQISNYVVGTVDGQVIEPASLDTYQKDVYKRIYHNLPLLLKSKGTERGLRALINCFGISSDILKIKIYGGRNTETLPFFGDYMYATSSLDKVRIDHTGSLIDGETLSLYTSNYKREDKYTDDLHAVEVGFSPSDNIDQFIISSSLANTELTDFNIDNYIGDPRDLTHGTYTGLNKISEDILGDLKQYDVRDYIRLIKFFDNTIFKMVRDFIPARASVDTGIIIKPHILNRSKAKSVKASADTIKDASINNAFNYTSSVDTAFVTGSNGGVFGSKNQLITSPGYVKYITPVGTAIKQTLVEDAKFTGELTNSKIVVSTGELNSKNVFKNRVPTALIFNVSFYETLPPVAKCTLVPSDTAVIVQPFIEYNLPEYFITSGKIPPKNTEYKIGTTKLAPNYTFVLDQYQVATISANAGTILGESCSTVRNFRRVSCDLQTKQALVADYITQRQSYDLSAFFNLGQNTLTEFAVLLDGSPVATGIPIADVKNYIFPKTKVDGSTFTVAARDQYDYSCSTSVSFTNRVCPLGPEPGIGIFYSTVVANTLSTAVTLKPDDYFINNLTTGTYFYRQSTTTSSPTGAWIALSTPTSTVNFTGIILQFKCVNFTECEKIIQIQKEIGELENKTIQDIYWSDSIKQACNLGDVQGTHQLPDIGKFIYTDNKITPVKTLPKVLSEYKTLYRITETANIVFTGVIVYKYVVYVIIDGLLSRTIESCDIYNNLA